MKHSSAGMAAYVFEVLLVLLYSCGGWKHKPKTKPPNLSSIQSSSAVDMKYVPLTASLLSWFKPSWTLCQPHFWSLLNPTSVPLSPVEWGGESKQNLCFEIKEV